MIYDNESIVIDESNAMEVVNEVYFGKTKEILAIEHAVRDLRGPYIMNIDHNFNPNTYIPTIDKDPNHKVLNDAIANAFGFGGALVNIKTTPEAQVGTMPTSICIDLSSGKLQRSLSASKLGFKYDGNDDIVFVMDLSAGVLVDPMFTDAEITAAILHEVGHNFSPAVSRGIVAMGRLSVLPFISVIASNIAKLFIPNLDHNRPIDDQQQVINTAAALATTAVVSSNSGHRVMTDVDAKVRILIAKINKKYPALLKAFGLASGGVKAAINMIKSYMSFAGLIFAYPLAPFTLLNRLVDRISKPLGYEDEKFADAFATSYGYGEELNSFLVKAKGFHGDMISAASIPLTNAIKEVYLLPLNMVIGMVDEHPTSAARAKSSIKQLQRELDNNKSLDSNTRKRIQQSIKNIEDMYDFHEKETKGMPDGSDVKMLYQKILYNLIGGDIKGKFIATHVSDDIDKAYAATRESIDVYDNKERIGKIKENTDMMKNKFKDLMNF